MQRGLEHRGDVAGVGPAASVPSCTTDMSSESMIATMPLAMATGSMSGRTVPASCSAREPLGAGLAELGQRRDLEHPVGDLGLEAGEQPPGQRVAVDRVDQREDQRLAPVARRRARRRLRQALAG